MRAETIKLKKGMQRIFGVCALEYCLANNVKGQVLYEEWREVRIRDWELDMTDTHDLGIAEDMADGTFAGCQLFVDIPKGTPCCAECAETLMDC